MSTSSRVGLTLALAMAGGALARPGPVAPKPEQLYFESEAQLSPLGGAGGSDGCAVLVVWDDALRGATVVARRSLAPGRRVLIRAAIPQSSGPRAALGLWIDPGVDRRGLGDRVVFREPRIVRADPTLSGPDVTWTDLVEETRAGGAGLRHGEESVAVQGAATAGYQPYAGLGPEPGTLVVTAAKSHAAGIEFRVQPPLPPGGRSEPRVYRGMLHAHSSLSDGAGPPAEAFRMAREEGVDFFAVTDHAEMLRIPRFGESRWDEVQRAAREATVQGEFVALFGYEYTHPSEGHLNTLGADRIIDAITAPHWRAYLERLSGQPDAIGMFNHPYQEGTRNWNDFALPEDSLRSHALRQVALIRALDGEGRFGYAYRRALDKGWRVAPHASHDDHNPTWGRGGRSVTGVLAHSLTEDGILQALRMRRSFASQDRGLMLTMQSSEGVWMGGEVRSGPIEVVVVASDPVPDDTLLRIEILGRGNREIARKVSQGEASIRWHAGVELLPGEAVIARAVQRDGDEALSAPLFVR